MKMNFLNSHSCHLQFVKYLTNRNKFNEVYKYEIHIDTFHQVEIHFPFEFHKKLRQTFLSDLTSSTSNLAKM